MLGIELIFILLQTYDSVKAVYPSVVNKVHPIEGDCQI